MDPSIYLMDDDSKAPSATPASTKEKSNPEAVASGNDSADQGKNNPVSAAGGCSESGHNMEQVSSGEKISSKQLNKIADSLESVILGGNVPENKGYF